MKLFALLVGINDYPMSPLSQCVSDVKVMKTYLKSLSNHFEKIEIQTLTDKKASKKGIENGVSQFLAQATDEDIALFYYSGHGAHENADGRFPYEADGKLECLVAHHTSSDDAGFLLANKEIQYLFSKLPQNPHLISIFDCCHSGNIVRSIDETKEELTLKRLSNIFPARKAKEFLFAKEIPPKKFKTQTVEKLIPAKNSIHISACTSSQSSWENRKGGVFTRYLLTLLKATNNHLTYQEITRWAKVSLRNVTKTQQTPTIGVQGSGDLNPFSAWLNLPINKASDNAEKLVMHTQKQGWQLLRGSVMGMKKGMEVTIPTWEEKSSECYHW
ncbi:MAG: hypothetical protein ACI9XO_001117 [Paraglaciecola sp.]|jgi:hypothetical protein